MRVLEEGTRLADRYGLIRRLGAGGMSETWLADDRQTESRVALKFLAGQLQSDPRMHDLFHKEWRIGSRLMHPHIVRVFEFHDDADGPYYSQQFVDGPDLSVLCGQPYQESLRPVALIADALRYAHGKEIVHRDLKAANVLLDGRGAPYLIDFGVADETGARGSGGGSTVAQSPQQRAGGSASPADDIFALGVLIHELVNGNPPRGEAPVSLETADGRSAPPALNGLVNDMLAPDPARRPDAEQVAQRLAEAGVAAGPAPVRLLGEHAAIAASPAVESVQTIQPVRRAPEAPGARPEVPAQSSGVSPAVLVGGLGGLLALFLLVIFVLPEAVDREPAQTGAPPDDTAASAGEDGVAAPDATSPDEDLLSTLEITEPSGGDAGFSENIDAIGGGDAARLRAATDEALGDLLSRLERLEYRAIDRWGGQPYLDAINVYKEGDQAYLNKNYATALQRYRKAIEMLDPFFERIEPVFQRTMAAAKAAFDRGDAVDAVENYDLAVAITPGHAEAEQGLKRALNLEQVMTLTDQGFQYEEDLELDAAKLAFETALELDPQWEPAAIGLERVRASLKQRTFDQRMTEGLDALALGEYESARVAFRAAAAIDPSSTQPADGLLQVDQEIRLANIRRLENQANVMQQNEEWEAAIGVYQEILKIDGDLQFAKEGLALANSRAALHKKLTAYIDDPDSLSLPATMQIATRLLLDVSRMSPMGPRLEDQKNELSRLLKRAATPLTVQLISDNATDVAIYKVGKLGTFSMRALDLRPGAYVAVGSRPGYRDVRLEFRVAPEIEMKPIVIQCEEPI